MSYLPDSCLVCHISRSACLYSFLFSFFFFNDTATTEIYTLSLHDALPISCRHRRNWLTVRRRPDSPSGSCQSSDRKSTRLNSSHRCISYAVFCLKKKKKKNKKYNRLTQNIDKHYTMTKPCSSTVAS